MMPIRILNAKQIRQALPMSKAIQVMRRAFGQFSAGRATVPLRTRLQTDKGVMLLMPAYMQTDNDLAVKLVSVYGENWQVGLPTVSAVVMVFDPQTGRPRALLEGDTLTALRTGAGGGLAADLLSRLDASKVAVFGAGVQGRAQLEAVMAVRKIRHVCLVAHTSDAALRLAAELKDEHPSLDVEVVSDPQAAVKGADIVISATTSLTPVFKDEAVKPGTHITGVGSFTPEMQEIDAATVKRARVVVDSRQGCLAEAGDVIKAGGHIDAELGDIVNGKAVGRIHSHDITFFKSVGLAVQDAAAAAAVLQAAEKQNLGTLVEL
jgi:ornithine cyclodeaminase/alanine dehydrogenase-like protein (mu-crystallin family)